MVQDFAAAALSARVSGSHASLALQSLQGPAK